MAWTYLLLAGLAEIGFTTALRYTDGFTRLPPTLVFVALCATSLYLLSKAVPAIPVGTAYAVWTGIGAAGTAVLGIIAYDEPANLLRLFFLTLLVGSIIGLKLVG